MTMLLGIGLYIKLALAIMFLNFVCNERDTILYYIVVSK